MDAVTLSTKYRLVIPRDTRERLRLRPGMRFTVMDKGGIVYLIPERPVRSYRGIARGMTTHAFREKAARY